MQTVQRLTISSSTAILEIDKKTVLERLPVAKGASFDSNAEEDNPICLPNTRVELLQQISTWADDPGTEQVFWLNGMAGTGKSTISRTVADLFATNGQLGASFFFKRGEGDRGISSKLFTTLAAQIAARIPSVAYHIKKTIDADSAIADRGRREQFEKLILQPLAAVSQETGKFKPIIIVIDALDECEREDDVKHIIYLFSRTENLQSVRLKTFLTSRPELPIRLGFKAASGKYRDLILHEMPDPVVEHDICVFLEHKLAKIRDEYNASVPESRYLALDWPGRSGVQSLVKMAIPLFIFAGTVCRFLADRKCGSPDKQLQEVLRFQTRSQESKLDATYLPVLNKLVVGLSAKQKKETLQQFRDIVGSIIILASPLSTSALAQLLSIKKLDIDDRLDMLHSVLSIPLSAQAPVRLLHLSFRDFLLDPAKRGHNPFWIDEKRAHQETAAKCLRVMGYLRQDICDAKAPGTCRFAIENRKISTCLSPEVQYACLYWVYHIQEAGIHAPNSEHVYEFLTCHFLHWIEALSLMGRASESINLIRRLQSVFEVGL